MQHIYLLIHQPLIKSSLQLLKYDISFCFWKINWYLSYIHAPEHTLIGTHCHMKCTVHLILDVYSINNLQEVLPTF